MVKRWEPENLDALRSFVENGGASETRFYEFKEQLPSNKAVAKQLAGFAINGGSLVIGVAEPESGRFEVRPIKHADLREKVGQIAQSGVDPPLFIESRLLKEPNDDSRGVLWITVPPSPEAPHQVGGVYYERGDTQTQPMKDGAVVRLMTARRRTIDEITAKLEEFMENDPIPNGTKAHVFGIAEPIGASPEELYEAIKGEDGWLAFCEEAKRSIEEYPPVPGLSSHGACRPWHTLSQRGGVAEPNSYTVHSCENFEMDDDHSVFRMSFRDDGTITYFNNVGSTPPITSGLDIPPDKYFLRARWIVASCLDVLDAARAVARHTGQRRSWDVGFGLTGTKGLYEYGNQSRISHPSRRPFPDPSYKRLERVNHQQIEADVWGVARKLTRRFLTGCDLKFEQIARELGYIEAGDTT